MAEIGDWLESLNSAYTKDETLAFESPILKEACAAWSRVGGIPPRSAFTPRSSKAFLGNLIIFERKGGSFLIRLMGTRISTVLGEMQGKTVDDALPPEVAKRWKIVLSEILDRAKPVRVVKRVAFNDLHYLEAELFLAPLLDAEGQPTMLFVVAAFRSGVAPSRKFGDLIADGC
ncbi:PAS domain-containing protein [Rhizomicrobium electricum]|uniref:PAS domain-containing protein n=1 Tax=Rhizomicrobium electricum TaxID=480070 RepID=A0ABN1EAJ9_9PROT|nr:hypothetical protein [Rhizomicrobium electricum]